MDSWAVLGPFDFSNATNGEMVFQRWHRTQQGHDYLKWFAAVGSGDFYGWRISGSSDDWVGETFDLTDVPGLGSVMGEEEVWLAFKFDSDGSGSDQGAFMDDVLVRRWIDASTAWQPRPDVAPAAGLEPWHEARPQTAK
jgi:hypothetical protein